MHRSGWRIRLQQFAGSWPQGGASAAGPDDDRSRALDQGAPRPASGRHRPLRPRRRPEAGRRLGQWNALAGRFAATSGFCGPATRYPFPVPASSARKTVGHSTAVGIVVPGHRDPREGHLSGSAHRGGRRPAAALFHPFHRLVVGLESTAPTSAIPAIVRSSGRTAMPARKSRRPRRRGSPRRMRRRGVPPLRG